MIAAGEVVARPASVVKELMENAVDAGATSVSVVIRDAGRTLIQVADNGCGMSRADAVLCFERHATSKIAKAEDLESILTFGFRGEALPSIASISEVTLKTRRKDDESGTKVQTGGDQSVKVSECSCPVGANFEVRNLFFNTPARRKFLKSENVEFRHIVEEFTRVALSRVDMDFSLTHNDRNIFTLKAAKSLKFRILDLLGKTLASDVVDIQSETPLMKLSGFLCRPDAAKKTAGNQYFFVNGRYFRSGYLHKAVMKAYEEMIPEGLNPSYFLFIEIDPTTVDVNIHPTKTEIKFEDESLVFQTLYACVRQTLGQSSFSATLDFDTEGAIQMPSISEDFLEFKGENVQAPRSVVNPVFNPFEPDAPEPNKDFDTPAYNYVDKTENYGVLFDNRSIEASRAMVIGDKYILTPSQSGVLVVNIRRAKERIYYERCLKAISKGQKLSQTALFPIEINVGVQDRLLFDENAELLGRLGFEIKPIGDDTISVEGVPEGFSCESGKIRTLISDITLVLQPDSAKGVQEVLESSLAHKFAVLSASSSESIRSGAQAEAFLEQLYSTDNSSQTSDGRKIAVTLSIEDIEKLF